MIPIVWTSERIDALKQGCEAGLSFADIAAQLGDGITRNACIGKARRMGFSNVANRPPRAPTVKKPRVRKINSFFTGFRTVKKNPEPFVPRADDIVPLGLEVLDLTSDTCRWPYGDGPITFCGHPIQEGKPYCAGHCTIAYIPPRGRYTEKHISYVVESSPTGIPVEADAA